MTTDIREAIDLIEASTKPAKLETTPLPYAENALDPVLSKASIDYHYEHLAKGYAKRYNAGEGNADFNRAGSFLHNKFFPYDDFKAAVKENAMKIQGSGWIYLSTSGDIKTIPNHQVRNDIALLIDWWEHVWALDYQWDKEKYLDNIWKIIDWDVVNQRL
jgi:superoxide dismutase, Fe-Mn family